MWLKGAISPGILFFSLILGVGGNHRSLAHGGERENVPAIFHEQKGASKSGSARRGHPDRNIVIFISDDHGQHTGAYGTPVQTPHLDALAADGTLFTHAFATVASCSPSRSVILSGLQTHANGQFGLAQNWNHFSSFDQIQSLPVVLSNKGYRTARVGKHHVEPAHVYDFDEDFEAAMRNPVEMADAVRNFLLSESDAPFFLYVATYDPHRSGDTAEEIPTGPNRFGNLPKKSSHPGVQPVTYDPSDVAVPPYLPDNPTTRAEIAQYYQSISRIDQGFGRLIDHLKEAGVYDQTLVIYMSDHGIAMPGAKTTVYEPGLLSPLIIRNPYEQRRGVVSQAMVSWTDIMPTILDFAGVDAPSYEDYLRVPGTSGTFPGRFGLHGKSFLSVLDGSATSDGWDEVYASHTFHTIQMYYPMRAVRGRRYKLIWNLAHELPFPFAPDLWSAPTWQVIYKDGIDAQYGIRTVQEYIYRSEFELYDMQADPWEQHNLASDSAYADVLQTYIAKIQAFQIATSDPWFTKWQFE